MANLKIGVDYIPNYKVINPDGTKGYEPRMIIYFDSDKITAQQVFAELNPKKYAIENGTISRSVSADKFNEFIHSKFFQKVLNVFAKYNYAYDLNNLQALEASAQQEVDNVLTNDVHKKIYSDTSSFIDGIIKAMEENMNDPNFMNYVNAAGSIQRVGDDVLSQITKLSYKNCVMVLSQWVNAGNSGAPTILATKRQWSLFFNRDVNPDATPLYAVAPKDVTHRTVKQTMADFGISQADYDANPMVQKQIDTLTNDKDFGQYINTKFGLVRPYYDYSQTTLQPGAQENYDFGSILSRNFDKDKDKEEDSKRGEVLDAAVGDNKIDMDAVLSNIGKYASKNNDNVLSDLVAKKNMTKIVEYFASISESINREVDESKKRNYRNILTALLLKRLRVNVDLSDRLLNNVMNKIVPFYDRSSGRKVKLTKKVFYAIASDFQNVVSIFFGMNESVSNNTIMWMLDQLNISVDEFRNMPYDDNDAENMVNGVMESFNKIYKKLLKS